MNDCYIKFLIKELSVDYDNRYLKYVQLRMSLKKILVKWTVGLVYLYLLFINKYIA